MKYYNILFFKLYQLINKTNKSIPEWSTIIALSLILIFNLISISLLFNYPLKTIGTGKLQLIFIIIVGFNYFVFLKKNRYKMIIKESKKRKKNLIENVLFLTFLIGSVLLFFLLMKYK